MWKIFVIIAAVALVAAGVMGYQNKAEFEGELENLAKAVARLEQTNQGIASTKAELKKNEDELAVVQTATVKLTAEVSTVELAVSEQDKKEGELSAELDKIVGSIASAEDLIKQLGPIEDVEKEMERLKNEVAEAEKVIQAEQNTLAVAEQRNSNLKARVETYVTLERKQLSGDMPPGVRALVTSANNQWGFVVLDKGEKQGIVPRAQLAVARDGYQICKLTVTTLEPDICVASIVKDTLPAGYRVVPGDLVVVLPKTDTAAMAANDG